MLKLERKCRDLLVEHFGWVAMMAVFFTGIIVRCTLLPFISDDFGNFYVPWMKEMRRFGGNVMVEDGRFNYSPLFFYLYKIVGDIFPNAKAEALCKAMSVFPEMTLSLVCVAVLDRALRPAGTKVGVRTFLIFAAFWLNPLLILSGAAWGQTDCYYVLFSLLAVWLMIRGKPVWAIAALGVSCSWKLQGIFLVPLVILMYLCGAKRFSILWLLLIPAVMTASSLPMALVELDPLQIFHCYFGQIGEHHLLTFNYPNLYGLLEQSGAYYSILVPQGIGILGAVFCATAVCLISRKKTLEGRTILLVGAWSVLMCVFLLPSMHERYALAGELLLLVYAIVSRSKKAGIAAVLCTLATMNAYLTYLVSPLYPVGMAVPMQLAAVILTSWELWNCITDGESQHS